MYKNNLQEFCQRDGLVLPDYKTERLKSPDHQPKFISSVAITYNNTIYKTKGKIHGNKKKAELSAAKEMLSLIDDIVAEETQHYTLPNDIYILIDMENIHMGNFFEKRKFGPSYHFIGFATEHHPSIKAAPSQLKRIECIESDRKDACDILIIGYVAQLIMNKSTDIIIVTQDHFGPGLVDYIHHINPNINAKVIKTVDELGNYFDAIQ